MASSGALDQEVGQVVATLPDGTEYRQVLLNPADGETHVTPDGRKWVAVHEEVVDGKVVQTPFTIHWKGPAVVRAKAISVAQLSAAAHSAAEAALRQTANLTNQKADAGVVIDPLWVTGLVFRDADLQHLGEYLQVANQVASQVQGQGGSTAANVSLYLFDQHVLTGYRAFSEEPQALE